MATSVKERMSSGLAQGERLRNHAAHGHADQVSRACRKLDQHGFQDVRHRPRIIAAQAHNLLLSRSYTEARDLLAATEAAHPTNAVIKSMLALCMYVQKDGLWEAYAEEALALPKDPVAIGVIESLAKSSGKALRGLAPAAEPAVSESFEFIGLAC